MSFKRPFNKVRNISKITKELFPIARDSVLGFLNESINPNPDQIEVALLTGLTAFLSTLKNGGQHDQAYRAAVACGKSVPHAVDSANIIGDRYHSPRKKTFVTIRTASGLIKRAALSTLTGFPEHKKELIGRDIEGTAKLFTLIPKKSRTKGRGLFGAGAGSFENNLNTEWLNPNDDDVVTDFEGSGLFDWFSSSNSTDTSTVNDPMLFNTTDVTPAWADPNLTTPADADPTLMSTDADQPLSSKIETGLKAFGLGALGLLTGNPAVQGMALQVGIPLAWQLGKTIGKGLYMVGDATIGTLRRKIKEKDWEDTNRTSTLGRIGHGMARTLKGIYQWNDKQMDAMQRWWTDHNMQSDVQKLGATISTLAPALGQDYLAYKQRMLSYQQQQKQAKAQFDYEQKKEKEEIERHNAELKARNERERKEALMYNSDRMAEYADDMAFFDELKKHDEEVKQAKEDYLNSVEDWKRIKNEEKRADLTATAKRESRDAWIDSAKGAIVGTLGAIGAYTTATGLAASGTGIGATIGVPLAILGAALTAGATYLNSANDHAERSRRLSQEAAAAEANGDIDRARRLDAEASREADIVRDKMAQGFEEQRKFEKERAAAEAQRTKLYMDGMTDAANKFADAAHSANRAFDASERAERYANMSVEPEPTDRSNLFTAPRRKPKRASMKFVPDEMTDDDPRLKKFVAKEFYEAPLPADMYATTYTTQAVQRLPYVLAQYDKSEEKPVEMPDLPYVNPLPVTHVNPSSGNSNTLRTRTYTVQKPTPYIRTTPMMANSLNTLQPVKRVRRY